MIIIKSLIFSRFPEICFGFSTRINSGSKEPYGFNVSLSVGDDEKTVKANRKKFYSILGLDESKIAFQKQVHGDNITIVDEGGQAGESDAMITTQKNIGLAVSTADCTPIFIYDPVNSVIAGVHSGWRSTQKKILEKVLIKLLDNFKSSPENLVVYIGPSISRENYEVGEEVAALFESKYLQPKKGKFLLDVAGVNYDILLKFGIEKNNIQRSSLCTYQMKNLLHSYRRDGTRSGRAFGIIAIKE